MITGTQMTEETLIQEKERSVFLTVLCVLTFICVPIFITINAEGWFISQAWSSQVEHTITTYGSLADNQNMSNYMEEAQAGFLMANITFIVNIIGALICLCGTLQMWRHKKTGYYLYLIGEIGPIIICVYTLSQANILGSAAPYIISLLAVPALTFAVLYGLNLKDLN